MENIKFYLIKGGRILQNMILKDIISAKAIKDELFLLRTNVKSLMLSWRITLHSLLTFYNISIFFLYCYARTNI